MVRPTPQSAFSTLEILIAMSILILIVSAIIVLSFSNQSLVVDAETNTEALNKAKEVLYEAQNLARQNFDSVQNQTQTDGIYTKQFVVDELDAVTKKISVEISWQNNKKVSLYSIITDLKNGPGSNTCSFVLSGNWSAPKINTIDLAQTLNDLKGSYSITDIDSYLGKLYITVSNRSGSIKQPTFFIFDLRDPRNPNLIAQLDNDNANAAGLNALTVAGQYAYVASDSARQLQIIKIDTNPPQLIKTYQIPGVAANSTQGIGRSIAYKNGYVFIGLTNPVSGAGFNIIDVNDPFNPKLVGAAIIGHAVNAIYIRDHYAYVVSPDANDLQVFDISPIKLSLNMNPIGIFNGAGGVHGKSIFALGNKIFLGRTHGSNEFYILNSQNLSAISSQAVLDLGTDAGTSINGLAIRNNLAFFLTTSDGLQIWNIVNLSQIHKIATINMPNFGIGSALDCEGNYLYAASNDSNNRGSINVISSQ